jgi:hypothetical protein
LLFATIPYENTIGTAELTADAIISILNEQQQFQKTLSYNGIWGIHPHRDLKTGKIESLSFADGSVCDSQTRILVAFNSHAIAGGGGRFPELKRQLNLQEARLFDTAWNSRDIVREYLINNADWHQAPIRWIKNTN